jgi:hypothetical protein
MKLGHRLTIFIVALSILMSFMLLGVNAQMQEDTVCLVVVEGDAVAEGHTGGGLLVLLWANYPGMTFEVNNDELLCGVTFRTIVAGKPIKANLYRWNGSTDNKELLESKTLTSLDWQQVVYDFDTVYPAGKYYLEIETFADNGTELYLYVYKKVVEGRNIKAYQYDQTFDDMSATSGKDFGEGFDMSIKLLTGATADAQAFVKKYHEAKAEGVTVSDQAKYDAVMNAVGDDLKTFLLNASNAEIKTQLDNLTAALQEDENPPTGDTGCLYLILLVVLTAVLLNKKMVRIAKK